MKSSAKICKEEMGIKKVIPISLFLIIIVNYPAVADLIKPFRENNSIDVINGEVWVATHLNGPHMTRKGYVFQFNPSNDKWYLHLFPSPILSITHLGNKTWLGTYSGGVIYYDSKTKEMEIIKAEKSRLINNYVNTVICDNENLYCATNGGVSIYNFSRKTWISFNNENSELPTPYIFDIALDKNRQRIWVGNSNYWYVYYEAYPMDNEKGSIACYDIKRKQWNVFSGTRKQFVSDTTFVEIKGEIPAPNSNFGNIVVGESSDIWFSFDGGIGLFKNSKWGIYIQQTCGINFGRVSDIAYGESKLYAVCSSMLLKYEKDKDTWNVIGRAGKEIPGTVIRAIYVDKNTVWIKSYDPNFWIEQGLSRDPLHEKKLKEKSESLRLTIDGNIVDVQCKNKTEWQRLYNPGYMEFLTLYKNGNWESWELTRMLIDSLVKK